MAISITDFINKVSELDKSNLFLVQCDKLDDIKYYVTNVVIPEKTNQGSPFMYVGQQVYIPGPYTFGDLIIEFREDYAMSIRTFIEKWMNEIYLAKQNMIVDSIPFDSSLTVTSLDETLNPVMQWHFINAIPTKIDDVSYSYEEEAGHTKPKVTFKYSRYEISGINSLQVNPTSILSPQMQQQYQNAMNFNSQTLDSYATLNYQSIVSSTNTGNSLANLYNSQQNTDLSLSNTLTVPSISGLNGVDTNV